MLTKRENYQTSRKKVWLMLFTFVLKKQPLTLTKGYILLKVYFNFFLSSIT